MKLLLLFLGLGLVCAQKEEKDNVVKSNFDMAKASGKWYSILLSSDQKEKIEENGSMRVFVEFMQVLDSSSLFFKFHTINPEMCSVFSIDDGNNKFKALEADYNKYIIFHLINDNDGNPFQLMELYGRDEDISSEIKEKFVEYCKQYGIPEENIIDLTKVARAVMLFALIPITTIWSAMSKLIKGSSYGKVFVILQLSLALTGVVTSVLYNEIYQLSMEKFAGPCFILSSFLSFLAIVPIG
ncbi:PREDICTED: salivary lipocalin-like [Elephantulus edwardii]|uniref:salivary lipocalin-like n=1 Tax=Elephantulus edwardii TaxID=28737 RepID=UPI0003F05CDE|nr:PREDICTED: salivary lipocalin-like [Elephantulus edwardii]